MTTRSDGDHESAALASVMARVPGWAGAGAVTVSPLEGLTNTNYRVVVDGERFVVRIGGPNAAFLGIDRVSEVAALRAASCAGIGPEVVEFILPEGHLVTRLIEGRQWDFASYCTDETLSRLVATLRRLHRLHPNVGSFSPFRRVETLSAVVRSRGVPLPDDFDRLLGWSMAIEARQRQDSSHWLGFCHNDLYSVNLLDDGGVRIIDWEFAGMGDVYFDLATLVYAYDTESALTAEQEDFILAAYFGSVDDLRRERLQGMKLMVLFNTAMWGLIQEGLRREGLAPTIDGFDYLTYAEYTFGTMRGLGS